MVEGLVPNFQLRYVPYGRLATRVSDNSICNKHNDWEKQTRKRKLWYSKSSAGFLVLVSQISLNLFCPIISQLPPFRIPSSRNIGTCPSPPPPPSASRAEPRLGHPPIGIFLSMALHASMHPDPSRHLSVAAVTTCHLPSFPLVPANQSPQVSPSMCNQC